MVFFMADSAMLRKSVIVRFCENHTKFAESTTTSSLRGTKCRSNLCILFCRLPRFAFANLAMTELGQNLAQHFFFKFIFYKISHFLKMVEFERI
ncbi:hypothetical protein ACWIUD_01805 [Helicobacter sp. 23-1044]